jgi:ribonuclease T2
MLPAAAAAQAYQCRPPTTPPAVRAERPPQPVRRVPTTGYTLALSWAPEFCRGRERDPRHALQCSGAMGRFGFVVHGLWPEGEQTWPQWCRAVPPPSPTLLRGQLCRTPSVELVAHQWAKHGSCMNRTSAGYFRVSNIIADSMRYPPMERLSRDKALTAGALRQAFAAANVGRPPGSFGLLVSRSGWLKEVRVCMNRRFRAARCPTRQKGPPDGAVIKVWRGL